MSRIRSIHPGLWTDEAFMRLSANARLLYIGLWTEAWDDGVFEWKPLTLKAKLFPVDNVDVSDLLTEIEEAGSITMRHDPKPHGLIRNFRLYQRPKKPNSSGLLHPDDEHYVGVVPNQSGTGAEKSPQMEDGGGREGEEKTPPLVVEAEGAREFEEVWEVFPRNPTSVKAKAEAAYRATKAEDRPAILAAARARWTFFEAECVARKRTQTAGLRYEPHLAKWLEDGAWRQPAAPPKPETIPMIRVDRYAEEALFAACERALGKAVPSSMSSWAFAAEVVEKARTSMH